MYTRQAQEAEGKLPELREGQPLELKDLSGDQHFTQPPPRYTCLLYTSISNPSLIFPGQELTLPQE